MQVLGTEKEERGGGLGRERRLLACISSKPK